MRRDPVSDALGRMGNGDPADRQAMRRMFELFYADLRRLARLYMNRERAGHTLQPTALVHEAFLKLAGTSFANETDQARFMSIAASAMREVLVDHARTRNARKRGRGWTRVTLDSAVLTPEPACPVDVLDLDRALTRLSGLDARAGRVAEMRIFAGLSSRQAAAILAVSERTVSNDWTMARLWLCREISA
jgi:RNA polymerase sigma-70 factor (ECF subfamily)